MTILSNIGLEAESFTSYALYALLNDNEFKPKLVANKIMKGSNTFIYNIFIT